VVVVVLPPLFLVLVLMQVMVLSHPLLLLFKTCVCGNGTRF
jgi:hypothetical protein